MSDAKRPKKSRKRPARGKVVRRRAYGVFDYNGKWLGDAFRSKFNADVDASLYIDATTIRPVLVTYTVPRKSK